MTCLVISATPRELTKRPARPTMRHSSEVETQIGVAPSEHLRLGSEKRCSSGTSGSAHAWRSAGGNRRSGARSDRLRAVAGAARPRRAFGQVPGHEAALRGQTGKSDVCKQPIAGLNSRAVCSRSQSGPTPRCGVVSPLSHA